MVNFVEQAYLELEQLSNELNLENNEFAIRRIIQIMGGNIEVINRMGAVELPGIEKTIMNLVIRTGHVDHWVREDAKKLLARIGEPAVESLILAISQSNNQIIAGGCAEALGKIRNGSKMLYEKIENALIEGLESNGKYTRCKCAEALGEMKSVKAVEKLIERIRDGNEELWIKRECARALGEIGVDNGNVRSALELLYGYSDCGAKRMAEEAIGKMNFRSRARELACASRVGNSTGTIRAI